MQLLGKVKGQLRLVRRRRGACLSRVKEVPEESSDQKVTPMMMFLSLQDLIGRSDKQKGLGYDSAKSDLARSAYWLYYYSRPV